MATKQDYTEIQKTTKSYYDTQNEREIAARQFIAAKTEASNEAIASGRAKNNIKNSSDPNFKYSSYNPDNWEASKNEQVIEQDAKFRQIAIEEKQQRENVATLYNDLIKNGDTPEQAMNKATAAGLKPGDIQTSLYSTNPTDVQTAVVQERANAIMEQANTTIEKNNTTIKEELKPKSDNLQSQIDALEEEDPVGNLGKIQALESQKAVIDTNIEKLNANNEILTQDTYGDNAIQTAQQQLKDEDPTDPSNVENTTKLSNTGFETINNFAPFYMQMPTLQSITDFRLKNGQNPYGDASIDNIARDAVNFRIFETTPGVAKAENVPGTTLVRNVIDDSRIQSVGSFTIYPSDLDWLSQSHQHTYGAGDDDWAASAVNTLGSGYSSFQGLLKMAAAGTQALAQGSLKGLAPTGDVYQRRLETLRFYQSSAPQTMSIKFNLFTKKDFLNDVFRPIMFLTALGYPKRSLEGEGSSNLRQSFQNLRKWADTFDNGFAKDILKGIVGEGVENIASWAPEKIQALEEKLASTGGIGPYRYFISKRPEFLSVRHVSGLFYFPLANITGFNYTFKGPWYNWSDKKHLDLTTIDGGRLEAAISEKFNNFRPDPNAPLKDRIDSIFQNFAGEVAANINSMREPKKKPTTSQESLITDRLELQKIMTGLKTKAYPSYAECTLEIQSSIPFFRDDYMALYNASSSPEELVNVTQKNTGDERFFGNRKARDNQVL